MQPSPSQPSLTIVPLKIADALLAASIAQGGPFYLVYDLASQRFSVVWWERLRWHCSCKKKGSCLHAQAVNAFLLTESQKHCITEDDLEAHIEDDLGLNR
jgi:hypothetical protein